MPTPSLQRFGIRGRMAPTCSSRLAQGFIRSIIIRSTSPSNCLAWESLEAETAHSNRAVCSEAKRGKHVVDQSLVVQPSLWADATTRNRKNSSSTGIEPHRADGHSEHLRRVGFCSRSGVKTENIPIKKSFITPIEDYNIAILLTLSLLKIMEYK